MPSAIEVRRGHTAQAVDQSQFLTIVIGQEEYGVEILKVQEIKGNSAITPIPNAPAYVRGVMNLRGTIIPVIDLGRRFGVAKTAGREQFSVIIVVNVGAKVMGLLVDAVSDVLDIPRDDIQSPPEFGENHGVRAIHGLAKAGDKVVLLLDIERFLAVQEQAALEPLKSEGDRPGQCDVR